MKTKSFVEYLMESIEKSSYDFVVKFAGDLPDHMEDTLKRSLEKYDLINFVKIRTTPIQNKLPDFPDVENAETTIFSISVAYPTTSLVLHSYIAEQTGVPMSNIKVRSSKEEEEIEINTENCGEKKSKPLLLTDYEKEKSPNLHGEKSISSFLKTLQKLNLTQYKGVNDQLLAKSMPKEKG